MKTYLLPCRCDYTPFWKSLCSLYGGNILDRTNTLTFGEFNYKTLTPIPEFVSMSSTFEELCDRRAYQLGREAEARNCKINLMWSGGIDSTTAAVSFLKDPIARQRLVILLQPKSIGEYPLFYELLQQEGVTCKLVQDAKKLLTLQDINITGEIGDQLFGSAAFEDAMRAGKLFGAPEDYFSPELLQALEPQRVHAPYPLEQVKDVMWWLNFSMKYQNVQLRIYPSVMLPWGGITHYFDTDYFQLWSMNNPDKKIRDTLESYKWPAKDYIYNYTKDTYYRDNKLKVGSLKIGPIKCSIDENFKYEVC